MIVSAKVSSENFKIDLKPVRKELPNTDREDEKVS